MCLFADIREEIDEAHALSASLADVQRQGHISVIDRQLAQHSMMKSETSVAAACSEPSEKYQGHPEDFPTLDGMPQAALPAAKDAQLKSDVAENVVAESAPPSEMSLAKKLALSSRLSVRNGPVDLADFPSLPRAKQTKPGKGPSVSVEDFPSLSSISRAKVSKMSTASVWNGGSKDTVDSGQSSCLAGKSKKFQHKNGEDDFPSLTSTVSSSGRSATLPANPLSHSSLANISRNFSSGSLSKMSNQVETASLSSDLSWGPELNRKPDNQTEKEPKDNFLHLKPHKNTGRSTVLEAWGAANELKSGVKPTATNSNTFGKPTVVSTKTSAVPSQTVVRENDKESGDASMASSPDWTQVGGEKKTEFKPSKKNNTKVSANKASSAQTESKKVTKSNVKTDDSSSMSKNGKDKSKKKQKADKMQKGPNAGTNSSEGAEKRKVESAINVDGKKSESEKAENVASDNQERSGATETLSRNIAGDNAAQSIEKQDASKDGHSGATLNGESAELATVEGTNPTFDETQSSSVAASVPVFTTDDFPSLLVNPPVPSLPSLPPGFSSLTVPSSMPPPPGFTNPEVPPGLSSALLSSYADDVDKPAEVDSEVPVSAFIPPRDMQQRTASFVSFISTAVKDSSFGEFQDLSAKFRSGNISADEYHRGCFDLMDPSAFLSIFPELIALLPDLPKQQELLKVHRDFLSKSETRHAEKTQPWSSTPDDGLVSCRVCGQVLRFSDLQDHASEHGAFNTEYPTLPNCSICSVR